MRIRTRRDSTLSFWLFPAIIALFLVDNPLVAGEKAELRVRRIELERGVVTTINDIHQDQTGYLWVATKNGLVRFDGSGEHQTFENKPGEKHSVLSNNIHALTHDEKGNLWLAADGGISRFTVHDNRFYNFRPDEDDGELGPAEGNQQHILVDDLGRVWSASYESVSLMDPEEEIFLHLYLAESDAFRGQEVMGLVKDQTGKPYLLTTKALYANQGGVGDWQPVLQTTGDDLFLRISALRDGRFAVSGPKNMLLLFDPHHIQAEKLELPGPVHRETKDISTVYLDRQGNLWLGTSGNGLIMANLNNGRYEILQHDPRFTHSLSFDAVTSVLEDNSGIIWVGTLNGFNKISRFHQRFYHVGSDGPNARDFSARAVNDILVTKSGRLWAAGNRNVWFSQIGDEQSWSEINDQPFFYTLLETKDQWVWMGGRKRVIGIGPEGERRVFPYEHTDEPGLKLWKVVALAEAENGDLWLGGEGKPGSGLSLVRLDQKQGTFHPYHSYPRNQKGPLGDHISALHTDRNGILWVGSNRGISRLLPGESEFEHYSPDFPEEIGLIGSRIYHIHEDEKGTLWFATDAGLHRFDNEKNQFKSFTKENGLPDNEIRAVITDNQGELWLSHSRGLTRYNPDSQMAINYDLHDGIMNRFNSGVAKSPDGRIYFTGATGLTYFDPETVHAYRNTHKPPIVIQEIYAPSLQGTLENPDTVQEIEIPLGESLYIAFSALDFTIPEKNTFSYRLEGLKEHYSRPSTNRWQTFNHLPPGKYRLHLRAANNDGVWNEEGKKLYIRVVPPWWRTTQAYVLYALLVPGFLFAGYRMRIKQLEARQKELQGLVDLQTKDLREAKEKTEAQAQKLREMDHLKTQFFSNVSHEFRTPLTLIIGPLESMLAGKEDGDPAKMHRQHEVMLRNARRLLRLINQLLDLSKLDAGRMQLRARSADLIDFLKPITSAFESFAEKREIRMRLIAETDMEEVWFDPEKIEKVMFNLISNAFQFTAAGGQVTISAESCNRSGKSWVRIAVKDTGSGIPAKEIPFLFDRFRQVDGSETRRQEGTGIGLSLVKELVTLHHGEVEVESEEGTGSTFIVWLPLGEAHLEAGEKFRGKDDNYSLKTNRAAIETSHLDKPTTSTEPGNAMATETILIVDDNPDIRQYISNAFAGHYRVLEAVDGAHGLGIVHSHRPDLIISDVMMPNIDGYEMCRRIKADRKLKHIPIVLLTAKASDEMKVEGLEIGADDYLSKPFNVRELFARVKNLLEIGRRQRNMRRSLAMAHRAQVSMLPQSLPQVAGLDLAALCLPAKEVGGDYYDFLSHGAQGLGIVIGDVSGKGMPAALYMTMTKGLVQAYAQESDSPKHILSQINRQFHKASTSSAFISLFYLLIDPRTRDITYCNAGHNPAVFWSAQSQEVSLLKSKGMALGLEKGTIFDQVVTDERRILAPGDILVLYTDGLTEGMNDKDEVYGEQRLMAIVAQQQSASAEHILHEIRKDHQQFVGAVDQHDDITAVIIKIPSATT